MDDKQNRKPLAVPSGRISRLARLGSMTAGVAGNMAIGAITELSRGQRPQMRKLVMTPGNFQRVTGHLARMRGAAMKLGQLVSMDAGDVLPPELAAIMARLRDQAHIMPPKQLRDVLDRNWGNNWRQAFAQFDVRPMAAASIGQVHRGHLKDGREVAIKVQYPGVARSIDSDVSNVGALLKLSGLVPKGFDLNPFLEEARRQLHEETDYLREGACLRKFHALLDGSDVFSVPVFHADWSTDEVLTMSYLPGQLIENISEHGPQVTNRVMTALIDLALREVFEFGITQSDPNFANYRYHVQTGKIVLLDFGATRQLDPGLTTHYRDLLRSGLNDDLEGVHRAAQSLYIIEGSESSDDTILHMIRTVFQALEATDPFDFSDMALSHDLQRQAMELAQQDFVPPDMPMDILYLQRKIGGLFLLATRLRAVLPVRDVLMRYV